MPESSYANLMVSLRVTWVHAEFLRKMLLRNREKNASYTTTVPNSYTLTARSARHVCVSTNSVMIVFGTLVYVALYANDPRIAT